MEKANNITNKYGRYIYLVSLICFMLLGMDSWIKRVTMVTLACVIFLTNHQFRSLKEMKPEEHFVSGLILILYLMLTSQEFTLSILFTALLAMFFVIHTVDAVYLLFQKKVAHYPVFVRDSKYKLNKIEIAVIALSSIVVMTFFTTSSPLYPFNIWDDTNCYFTLGRGIINDVVMYKDAFDHKGPYLYLIFAVAALISDTTFLGVYIIEIIACFVFAFFCWKTVRLFYQPKRYSLVLIPLGIILTYSCVPFHFGGSAEELSFPLLAIIMYLAFKAEQENTLPSLKDTAVIGLLTSVVLLIKFTFCGLILGYLIFVIYRCITAKELKKLPMLILAFLAGFIAAWIPVLLYFGVNGALGSFYEVYIYDNLFLYSGESTLSSASYCLYLFNTTMSNSRYIFTGIVLSICTLAGLKKNFKIMYVLMMVFSFAGTYLPSTHMFYYCFILTALIIPGFILISMAWDELCDKLSHNKLHLNWIACLVALVLAAECFMSQPNLNLIGKKKDCYPQLVFADVINETPDAKILTYDIMDGGFYNCSETLPATRYYCFTNITENLPGVSEGRLKTIENGEFDYIITKSNSYQWSKYEIIMESTLDNQEIPIFVNGEESVTYYLYARK